jgi:hypothetical protein
MIDVNEIRGPAIALSGLTGVNRASTFITTRQTISAACI